MSVYIPTPTLFLRTDKKKKNGKMPLYIRFQRIDGKEPKFSFGKKGKTFEFSQEEWDDRNKHPYDTELAIIIDNELGRIKKEVNKAIINEEEITIDLLRKIVENEIEDVSVNASFYDYFNKYIVMQEKKDNMSNGTFKSYMTTLRALKVFRKEIRIKDINEKFITDFEKFLIKRGNEAGRGDVEGSRYNRLRHVRAVINYIETKGKIKIENPFERGDITIKEPEPNDIFLEKEEFKRLDRLYRKNTKIGTVEFYTMSMFIFSCLTGLRISDILTLRWQHIIRSDELWIIKKILVKKVGGKNVLLDVPISKYALIIIDWCVEDYNDMEKPENLVFPKIDRNTINSTLREFAEKAGIEKHLTFHASRRTCATNFMINGMDRLALMKYMGHTSFNTTLKYVKWNNNVAKEYLDKIEIVKVKKSLIK